MLDDNEKVAKAVIGSKIGRGRLVFCLICNK